jgi:hypothetical protein
VTTEEVLPDDVRPRIGKNHYTFAIRMCVAFIEKWRQRYEYREPMQYVFDRLSKGKGDIDDALSIAASGGSDAIRWMVIPKQSHGHSASGAGHLGIRKL